MSLEENKDLIRRYIEATDRNERLGLLYHVNARVAEAFWEWQHKTLTLFTAGIGGLLAIEAWVFDHHFGRYVAIPPAAASLLSALCALFAQRNREILNHTHRVGAELEGQIADGLGLQVDQTFRWWRDSPSSTYRLILTPAFSVLALLFLLVAIAAAIEPPKRVSEAPPTTRTTTYDPGPAASPRSLVR